MYVSPENRKADLATSEPAINQWEYDSVIWQWLGGEGAGFSDEDKKKQIMQYGRDPADFGIY